MEFDEIFRRLEHQSKHQKADPKGSSSGEQTSCGGQALPSPRPGHNSQSPNVENPREYSRPVRKNSPLRASVG
jgi:hypothetical protein